MTYGSTLGYGKPVSGKTFLSSFAWGYGKVRDGKLKELATFADAERTVKAEIEKRLIRQNDKGEIQPIGIADINRVLEWLVYTLNVPPDEIRRPGIAVRVPQYSQFGEAPEPELLNSFYIEDLLRVQSAFQARNVGKALSTFMGVTATPERQDVVNNNNLLDETLAPERMPLTRWPGPGRHPLVLMQQAAINHSVKELKDAGLVAVNGPPGTGKTTLLRDIIAKVVLDRAIAMSKFDKPAQAFKHLTSMKTGNAFCHLYQLDDKLLGHEIVIASSNNKAVENISREIPSSSAIATDFVPPLRYFQSISDSIACGGKEIVENVTWGLAAAVLGNSANRAAFIDAFWWNKERGMATYLRAATGEQISGENKDTDENEEGLEAETRTNNLNVVSLEKPPRNETEALERWQVAKKDFLSKLQTVQSLFNKTQEIYKALARWTEAEKRVETVKQDLAKALQDLTSAQEKENTARIAKEKALDEERKAVQDRDAIQLLRPGFFARLFRTRSFKEWQAQFSQAVDIVNKTREIARLAVNSFESAGREREAANKRVQSLQSDKANAEKALADIYRLINIGRQLMGDNFPDQQFWLKSDDEIQKAALWIYPDLQKARDELFVAAFSLHRAFIDASAKPLKHNLRAALDVMKGKGLTDKQEPARQSLWASLFMVVPVISTTFASVARLFGKLAREQMGWLLIDEAGQALPQSAVGALWRSRRAIVIGDPLQIEPVVTIPPSLINSIFSQFEIASDYWAAPAVSVQSLADRVSWFGTTISSEDGDIWVGSPLRVHRRCEDPMFSLSNQIAYNGLMVYGTKPSYSAIGEVIGKSRWLHVEGDAVGKWSEQEGEKAVAILKQLLSSGVENPDIFFITPFRMVSYKLREMIRNDRFIMGRLSQNSNQWVTERVGTVHTFQGKEAEAVVLVLGAPLDNSAGARRWAGCAPNLLNVAVSRAKRRLFVIGNYHSWKNAGCFRYLAKAISVN